MISSEVTGPACFKLSWSNAKGRHVIAKAEIEMGNNCLRDIPSACVPFFSDDSDGNIISTKREPFGYTQAELSLLKAANPNGKYSSIFLASRLILASIAKASIKASVASLCSHRGDDRPLSGAGEAAADIVLRLVTHSLEGRDYNGMTSGVSKQLCRDILGKIESNAFTVVDDASIPLGVAVYPTASAINHDCAPSCWQLFDAANAEIRIRSVRSINAGEEISIAYIDIGKPVWWRRSDLWDGFRFLCLCNRCVEEAALLNDRDAWTCSDSTCTGVYKASLSQHIDGVDQYKAWLSGDVNVCRVAMEPVLSSMKPLSNIADCLSRIPFPCGNILVCCCPQFFTRMKMPEDDKDPNHLSSQYHFCCDVCGGTQRIAEYAKIVGKWCDDLRAVNFSRHKNSSFDSKESIDNSQHEMKLLERILKELRSLLPRLTFDMAYCVVEIRFQLCSLILDNINAYMQESSPNVQDAIAYAQYYVCVARSLETGLSACYPTVHAVMLNFYLQWAKVSMLLINCGGGGIAEEGEARKSLFAALKILVISHSTSHVLFSHTQQLLHSLS